MATPASTNAIGFISPTRSLEHKGDAVSSVPVGTIAIFNNPHYKGECVYLQCTTTAVALPFSLANPNYTAPNTAALGFSVAFSGQPWMIATSKVAIGEYGWFLTRGFGIVRSSVASGYSASATGSGAFIAAATGGKNILGGAFSAIPVVTASCSVTVNDGFIKVNGILPDEVFVGTTVSGTGIPASTVVSSINDAGDGFTLGSTAGAFDRVPTASGGNVTLTFTPTGYSYIHFPVGMTTLAAA